MDIGAHATIIFLYYTSRRTHAVLSIESHNCTPNHDLTLQYLNKLLMMLYSTVSNVASERDTYIITSSVALEHGGWDWEVKSTCRDLSSERVVVTYDVVIKLQLFNVNKWSACEDHYIVTWSQKAVVNNLTEIANVIIQAMSFLDPLVKTMSQCTAVAISYHKIINTLSVSLD